MCTYNGESFLREQLDSLARQTQVPYELIVCDDGSRDRTFSVLEDFGRHSEFPVKLIRNRERLGIVRNFEQAIRLCEGDLIALADQDDVWHPDKLHLVGATFADPRVVAAFSDAEVVDEALNRLHYTMWQRTGFHLNEQACAANGGALDVFLKHYVVTGATLVFHADLRPAILPLPLDWPHDAWIATVAATRGRVIPIHAPLVFYRQHAGNQVGGRKKSLIRQVREALNVERIGYYEREIARWNMLKERVDGGAEGGNDKIREKLAHLTRRVQLPATRWKRIPRILVEIRAGGYRRFARNWGSIAFDLFVK